MGPEPNLGLRVSGIALLAFSAILAVSLHEHALAAPPQEPTLAILLIAAAIYLSASFGSALLIVGLRLWEPVQVAERWRRKDQDR